MSTNLRRPFVMILIGTMIAIAKTRMARYAMVGLIGAITYYISLWFLVEQIGVPVMMATNAAFILVTIENYLLHHLWTFRSDAAHSEAFPRFLLMNAVGFSINWSVMFLGTMHFSFNYLWVQALAIVLVVLWNFIISSLWIFRRN